MPIQNDVSIKAVEAASSNATAQQVQKVPRKFSTRIADVLQLGGLSRKQPSGIMLLHAANEPIRYGFVAGRKQPNAQQTFEKAMHEQCKAVKDSVVYGTLDWPVIQEFPKGSTLLREAVFTSPGDQTFQSCLKKAGESLVPHTPANSTHTWAMAMGAGAFQLAALGGIVYYGMRRCYARQKKAATLPVTVPPKPPLYPKKKSKL